MATKFRVQISDSTLIIFFFFSTGRFFARTQQSSSGVLLLQERSASLPRPSPLWGENGAGASNSESGSQIPVIISLSNKELGNKNFIINKKLIKAAPAPLLTLLRRDRRTLSKGEQRKGSLGAVQGQHNVSLAITLLFKECFDYIYYNKEYYSNIFVHNLSTPKGAVRFAPLWGGEGGIYVF